MQTTSGQVGRGIERRWPLGFLGLFGLTRLPAFAVHEPLMLFWFAFFGFFAAFGQLRDELKYLGLVGVAGLITV